MKVKMSFHVEIEDEQYGVTERPRTDDEIKKVIEEILLEGCTENGIVKVDNLIVEVN